MVKEIFFVLSAAQHLKALFTPSVNVTVNVKNATFDRQMGMQPILPITVSVKKIKVAARQHNVVTVGVDEP